MSRAAFNFKDQLRVGNVGEADYLRVYGQFGWRKSTVRKYDFILGKTETSDLDVCPKSSELKTDTYRMEKSPNFFMERLTLTNTKSIVGGPWRSKEHGVDYFVYYFLGNKVFFWFRPGPLCEFLDKYIEENSLRPISIPNVDSYGEKYEAQGFKIPRDSVEHLLLKKHTL